MMDMELNNVSKKNKRNRLNNLKKFGLEGNPF